MAVRIRKGKTKTMEYIRASFNPTKRKVLEDNKSFFKAEYHLRNNKRVHITINKINGNISIEELKSYVNW